MTLRCKKPEASNSSMAADDLLEIFLDEYACRRQSSPQQINTFALLTIADKLDSIDTRLMHLVRQQEQPHE